MVCGDLLRNTPLSRFPCQLAHLVSPSNLLRPPGLTIVILIMLGMYIMVDGTRDGNGTLDEPAAA